MRSKLFFMIVCITLSAVIAGCSTEQLQWQIHDVNRPQPIVIKPSDELDQPPSDAIILFDGTDLSKWNSGDEPAKWKVENGYTKIVKDSGGIQTKQAFGNCQLHIEWATPPIAGEDGQHGSNSGVFLMGKYEIQIIESYKNKTYPDGQAGAMYGQYPPLVNASRPPGQWQSYDIIFQAPEFSKNGKLVQPAYITVLHNGVLVQNHVEIWGKTVYAKHAKYQAHPEKLPLALQDHGDPVRFRNIWIRELP